MAKSTSKSAVQTNGTASAKAMKGSNVTKPAKVDKKSKKPVKEPTPESESSEEEESDSDDASAAEDDDSESASDSSDSEEEVKPKTNGAAKAVNGTSKKAAKAEASSDSEDESEDSEGSSEDEAPAKPLANGKKAAAAAKEEDDDSEDSASDSADSSSEDEEEEQAKPEPKEPERAQKKRKAEEEAATANAKKTKTDENEPKTLFVGNLSWNITEEWLQEEFAKSGEVVGCRIISDRATGRSKGFGYVDFASHADAAKAHDAMKDQELDGRNLNIDFSNKRPEGNTQDRRAKTFGDQIGEPTSTLFLGNIAFGTTNEIVQEAFSEYGNVTRVSLPTDRDTGEIKGFGYVSFTTIDEAKAGLEAYNGQDLNGRRLRVDYAQPRAEGGGVPQRGGFGGRGRGNDRGGRGGGRGGARGGFGGRGGGRGGARGGRGGSTNRGGFGDFSGSKVTF